MSEGQTEVLPAPRQRGEVLDTKDVSLELDVAVARAEELQAVVEAKKWYTPIGGKKHLNIDAWCFLGERFGIVAETHAEPMLHPVDGTWIGSKGFCKLIDRRNGDQVGGATHVCYFQEETRRWPANHAEGMCQTRAVSRAFAQRFRFIARLGGFEGTPTEEMDGVGEIDVTPRRKPELPGRDVKAPADLEQPAWFSETTGFGRKKKTKITIEGEDRLLEEVTWGTLAQGSVGGVRYKFVADTLDWAKQQDNPGRTVRQFIERAPVVLRCMERRETAEAADKEF